MKKNYTTFNLGRVTARSKKMNRRTRKAWRLFYKPAASSAAKAAEWAAFLAAVGLAGTQEMPA